MITLVFPNSDAMLKASELMPAPTAVSRGDQGIIVTSSKPSRSVASHLVKLGVTAGVPHAVTPREVSSWEQAIPLMPSHVDPHLVMFRIPTRNLSAVSAEVRRLSQASQQFRTIGDDSFLRVDKPPYYTMLKERAYAEQFPNVWVRTGFRHPGKVSAPKDKLLFIDENHEWETIVDGPLTPIEIPQFDMRGVTHLVSYNGTISIDMMLKLTHSTEEPATFWVIKADSLNEFVSNADEVTISKLQYAIAGENVVIRTIDRRAAPPVLGVLGYKSHFLPNLFVPVSSKVFPSLRRDILRKILAPDANRVYWLTPDNKKFTPESLLDTVFRPLADHVEYTAPASIGQIPCALSDVFDLPSFWLDEEPIKKSILKVKEVKELPEKRTAIRNKNIPVEELPPIVVAEIPAFQTTVRAPSEWETIRKNLEEKFLAIEGAIDHPEREELWLPLARANAGHKDLYEAGICYTQTLWNKFDSEIVKEWAMAEFEKIPSQLPSHEPKNARRFAVALLSNPCLATSKGILDFEAMEKHLSVRLLWLTASRIYRADPLALARTRDRLLNRLLESGLSPEMDLPFFLRMAGKKDATRTRQIKDCVEETHKMVRNWVEKGTKPNQSQSEGGRTVGYVDMMFAYAFAKLGHGDGINLLVEKAKEILMVAKPTTAQELAGSVLCQAFEFRVRQAANEIPSGPFDPALFTPLAAITNAEYPIGRLRKESVILDPDNHLDPYAAMYRGTDFSKKVAALTKSEDFEHDVAVLYATKSTDAKTEVLSEAIQIAMLKSEEFTRKLISLVPEAIRDKNKSSGVGLSAKQGRLIERALFAAAHFDQRDNIKMLAAEFAALIRERPDERYNLVNVVAGQCFQSLRKLGMKDEINSILDLLKKEVMGDKNPAELKASAKNAAEWNKIVQSLLAIANGWIGIDFIDQAVPILDIAAHDLLDSATVRTSEDFAAVTNVYVAACGQSEATIPRIVEFFRKVHPSKVSNGFTTAPHYSRFHLKVVEQVVLALVGEASTSSESKRWLDEGEYLLRQRIHREVREFVEKV